MARLVVLVALFLIQLVELRMILTEGCWSHSRTWLASLALRTYYIKNDDLVLSLLQPATWEIQGLLRTYLPEAAEGMTIHVNLTFAESLHINKGVAHLREVEVATIVARLFVHPGVILDVVFLSMLLQESICLLNIFIYSALSAQGAYCCLVIIRDGCLRP